MYGIPLISELDVEPRDIDLETKSRTERVNIKNDLDILMTVEGEKTAELDLDGTKTVKAEEDTVLELIATAEFSVHGTPQPRK